MMKLLVLALTVTLLFTAGEALNCHHCVSLVDGGECILSEETCEPEMDACAAVRFLRHPYGHYQICLGLSDCKRMEMSPYIHIKCCTEDMCNTF